MFCHETNHGDENHSLAVGGAFLVITTETTTLFKPAKGSFDYPAAGKDDECGLRLASFHNREVKSSLFFTQSISFPRYLLHRPRYTADVETLF